MATRLVSLIGAPTDVGAGARGSSMGPEALRVAGSVVRFLTPATAPHSPVLRARTLARQLGTIDVPLDELKAAVASVNEGTLVGMGG